MLCVNSNNIIIIGGKDEYSKNSLVLANCSKILRTQFTNFFLTNQRGNPDKSQRIAL